MPYCEPYTRYNPLSVQQDITDNCHSPHFNGRLSETLDALARANTPKDAKVSVSLFVGETETARVVDIRESEVARLMGLTVKALREQAAERGVVGRSRMTKAQLAEALA